MSKLVTIFGGSGFLGRYIARRMAKEGWRVRVAVRRPNEAIFVRPYGAVGQVEPVLANIRDDASVAAAISGADAVVNCVGTFDHKGRNNFEDVHGAGARRIAEAAAAAGITNFVHVSALGADQEAESDYARTKAEGEAAVLAHMPSAVILRPSVMFGTEDGFFNRFASMTRFGPVLPLVGGNTKFQPVYVDDVAKAAVAGALGNAAGGIYELGGAEVDTLLGFVHKMLGVIRRRRLVVNKPFFAGKIIAWCLNAAQTVSLGLFHNSILTQDQVRQLRVDNVVSDGAKGLVDLGIDPTDMDTVLDEYLWVYRPGGQYSDLQASGQNLRNI